MFVLFLFIGSLKLSTGLKCLTCTYSPGISGHKDGCNSENSTEKYLTECANQTISGNETIKSKEGNDSQDSATDAESNLIGKFYCYIFTNQINGKWLTERGCGSSKVLENLHNTCENITDKISSALIVTNAKICYCNALDGCNNEIFIRNVSEPVNLPNSNFSLNISDGNNNRSKIPSTTPRNTLNAYQSKIQIVPNYQNPFDKIRRKNGIDYARRLGTIVPTYKNASNNNTEPPVLPNIKSELNVTKNISNDKIDQNGTIERIDNPVYNNDTTQDIEHVTKSESVTTIASTFTESEPKNASLNNDTTFEFPPIIIINSNTSENGSTKLADLNKDCQNRSCSENKGGQLLRPYLTHVELFVFISVIKISLIM